MTGPAGESGGNTAVLEGQTALRGEVRDDFAAVNARPDALAGKAQTGNAQIVKLLSQAAIVVTSSVGREPAGQVPG